MKIRSTCRLGLLAVCFAAFAAVSATAQDTRVRQDLSRSFEKFEVARPSLTVDNGSVEKVRLRAAGRDLELVVWRNEMLAPGYKAENATPAGVVPVEAPSVDTYRGRIAGEVESEVRVTINGNDVEGFFDIGRSRYFVEPAERYSEAAAVRDTVVYQEKDVRSGNSFYCASDMPANISVAESMVTANAQASVLAARNLEIATEADLEYITQLGGASQANANIVSILNMVEGTFASELDLEITVTYQHTWSLADPFAGANSGDVLNNFRTHWNENFPRTTYPRDTAHLFSGKPYVISAGVAYVGAVCSQPAFAYGVTGFVGWAPGKFLIPAHEIGHNLGADHAESAQGCGSTIMNAFLGSGAVLTFCPFSRDQIGTFIAQSGNCLLNGAGGTTPTPTPTPTPAPTATPTPTPFPTATPTPLPTPTPPPAPGLRTRFDFDGDRKADLALFRPSNGVWYMKLTTLGFSTQQFGQNGDRPVPADYDGDGRTDIAVYRSGVWYRINSGPSTFEVVNFGVPGDIAAPADFDADSRADTAVFRPSTGQWFRLLTAGGGFNITNFGVSGDVPMAADYDADGLADIAVWRPSNGTWYRLTSSGAYLVNQFGVAGDQPISGDFDGDRRADLAVWRPSNGNWYFLSNNTFRISNFGVSGDVPVPADFDADGVTDVAVFRPTNGSWYRLTSSAQTFDVVQYGEFGDTPAPSFYAP